MKSEQYRKMKIKNLRYNLALFTVATSLGVHVIASSSTLPKFNDEVIIEVETVKIQTEMSHPQSTANTIEVHTLKLMAEPEIIEKEYSGMKLSNEYEDEIRKLAETYNVPYEIILTIGYRESGGNWNNNGVISSTDDYGVFQINKCNLEYIKENLGYTEEEILNDPIKNAEACIYLLKDILKRESVDTPEEIFGIYNGWIGWKNKPLAVEYSAACCEIMDDYFPNFEYNKNQTTKL